MVGSVGFLAGRGMTGKGNEILSLRSRMTMDGVCNRRAGACSRRRGNGFLCVGNDRFLAGLGMTEVVGMVGKVARNDGEGAAVIGVGLVGYNIVR